MSAKGSEIIVESLENHRVPYIFGIPGAKIDGVFDVLSDRGPELILARHEQNAAFMAQAIGRLKVLPTPFASQKQRKKGRAFYPFLKM